MEKNDETLVTLINRGGIYYRITGSGIRELLGNLIGGLRLPPGPDAAIDREQLLKAALEREELMTTAIGHGIALPHPRNPLITDSAHQFVAIALLEQPVDWNALDGEKVHSVILIVSASPKLHLHTLSRINYFCRQETFYALLAKRAPSEEIIRVVTESEQAWR
ncbi:MAG: PTS sugar transporter subunit IIA [Spirochaetaceae bacterium]|jgi:PTS system nitrogen regulatory IIA component|nr:PTS sugar transporter subunit IIA [Spirochaetaceae bacterium]